MSTYQYAPLSNPEQDIRLLHLLPGTGDEALTATISHASLIRPPKQVTDRPTLSELEKTLPAGWNVYVTVDGPYIFTDVESDKRSWHHPSTGQDFKHSFIDYPPPGYEPSYEALSYTWGDQESGGFLEIIGTACRGSQVPEVTSSQCLQIGQNLTMALRHLRKHSEAVILWVDAVCINQDDISERNHQVQRMTDVYELANRVVVWLGESRVGSHTAISTLGYIGSQVELTVSGRLILRPEQPSWRSLFDSARLSGQNWRNICDLLDRPWFHRLWIVQEVQLANGRAIVMCGEDSISWSHLPRALTSLWDGIPGLARAIHQRIRALISLFLDGRGLSLWNLLRRHRLRGCSKKVDKVYGLLGLASGKYAGGLSPDYSLSLSQAYRNTFFACLQYDQRLQPLSYCDKAQRSLDDCPSWIPDWSNDSDFEYPLSQFSSGISRAWWGCIRPSVLRVAGKRCGIIKQVGECASRTDIAGTIRTIRGWEPDGLRSEVYRDGESLLHAFVTVIRRNILQHRQPTFNTPTLQHMTQMYISSVSEAPHDAEYEALDKHEIFDCCHGCMGQTFIVLEEGYIGLGPGEARLGDIVCVLLGLGVPIVLRPDPAKNGAFEIVGTAYIRGLEDASALLGPLPAPWIVQFRLLESEYPEPLYQNTTTGATQQEDPRLNALADQEAWEQIPFVRKRDDPALCTRFRHKSTGEIRNSDPRLDPDALRARGVEIEDVDLV